MHTDPKPLFENLGPVLGYDELSDVLRIPRRTLEALVSRREIPHRKVGLQVRFYWPAIEKWLEGDPKRSRR